MNRLFGALFKEFWRDALGGVRDRLEEVWEVSSGQLKGIQNNRNQDKYRGTNPHKSKHHINMR